MPTSEARKKTRGLPETFIVTVVAAGGFEADLEMPSQVPLNEVEADLIEVLRSTDKAVFQGWRGCRLRYKGRPLAGDETLAGAGAFDGSRLEADKI